ncbi:hypothetical protein AB0K45_10770, partial [Micrococcus luteus]|uniref:hypothetical protein n=1 Tax=Micrococcus luteus TaxID=1270 RepID=UPI003417F8DF
MALPGMRDDRGNRIAGHGDAVGQPVHAVGRVVQDTWNPRHTARQAFEAHLHRNGLMARNNGVPSL